jgi:choline dehydrogenase-like flavoprotein
MPEGAVVFVDGNNWYHGIKDLGFSNLGWFNYAKVSVKLIQPPRQWTATRYYVGQVQQRGDLGLYAEQRRYMAWLTSRDPRITIHYGRLEDRPAKDKAALKLRRYLAALPMKIDSNLYLLAADGDYTPAAEFVRSTGRKVVAAAPRAGAPLAAKVNTYMRLKKGWFAGCFGP